jgi:hypothetical protein
MSRSVVVDFDERSLTAVAEADIVHAPPLVCLMRSLFGDGLIDNGEDLAQARCNGARLLLHR